MAFPSPDPLWILELVKVVIMFALGIILLYRWSRAERRFYTDIPFLFALGFFILAGAESLDVIIHSGFLPPYDLLTYKIRAAFTGLSLVFFLYPTTLIWITERRRLGNLISTLYVILILVVILLAPTEQLLRILVIPFMLIVYLGFTISFFFAWWLKRLPDVHGLIISIGGSVTIIGQLFKVILLPNLVWISEIVEIFGLVILWLGLNIQPSYAKVPSST